MSDYLDTISIEDLPEEQRILADCIGMEAYIKLVRNYAGLDIHVFKPDTLSINSRNEEIRRLFDGANYTELAKLFRLSEGHIRKIVSTKLSQIRYSPYENQCTLFEDGEDG